MGAGFEGQESDGIDVIVANARETRSELSNSAIALLTFLDLCKAVDRGMVIEPVNTLEKSGGEC